MLRRSKLRSQANLPPETVAVPRLDPPFEPMHHSETVAAKRRCTRQLARPTKRGAPGFFALLALLLGGLTLSVPAAAQGHRAARTSASASAKVIQTTANLSDALTVKG